MAEAARAASHSVSRVMALMNQKGGVGKTTTTVNLAAGFARAGRPTLLVDLDPQAHATLHLGVEPGSGPASVYDALLDPSRGSEAVVEARPNLGLMPSEVDLAAAETELAGAEDRTLRLTRALAPLLQRYEFVLIDCPPSLGVLTLNALAASREAIAPMQAHFLALQGFGKLLETVDLVSREVNPRLRVTGVALCMHEESTKLSKEVVSDLERYFESARGTESPWRSARVLRPAIRRNVKLAECPSFGKTIFEYAPGATGAADYAALAEGLLREWDAMLSLQRSRRGRGSGEAPRVVVTDPSGDRAEAGA